MSGHGVGRGRRITAVERKLIIDLYRGGKAMRQIARELGRSYGAVNAVLHQEEGLEVKPRGGYRRSVVMSA